MGLLEPDGIEICRESTDRGSHGCVEGVRRELRFCVIESSIVLRDSLRKSEAQWSDLMQLIMVYSKVETIYLLML